jgi:hypothetical protein
MSNVSQRAIHEYLASFTCHHTAFLTMSHEFCETR